MYTERGFSAIPEDRFNVFISRAGLYVQEQTLNRLTWTFKPPSPALAEFTDLEESNIRGICDLAELFFRSEAAVGENGAAIISFTNEGYREVYEGGARGGSGELFQRRLNTILQAYFTAEQLSRRMGGGK